MYCYIPHQERSPASLVSFCDIKLPFDRVSLKLKDVKWRLVSRDLYFNAAGFIDTRIKFQRRQK